MKSIIMAGILVMALLFSASLLAEGPKDAPGTAPLDVSAAYVVEGIVYSGDNPSVMINGEIYKNNDMLGEARISNISKREVSVEYKGKTRVYETGSVIMLDEFLSDSDARSEELREEIERDREKKAREIIERRRHLRELTSDSIQYLEYDREKVQIDIYNPGLKSCPVVVLIHGAAGISGDRAERYRNFAMSLKKKGIIAINVHYFDTKWDRVTAIIKAVDFAQGMPNADKDNIGLAGYSLGGTIALLVASRDDRIKALAISAGYMPSGFGRQDAARLPKTYFTTGSEDTAMQTLRALEAWFKEMGKPFESRVVKGYGHDMPQELFDENWNTIVAYFVKNL